MLNAGPHCGYPKRNKLPEANTTMFTDYDNHSTMRRLPPPAPKRKPLPNSTHTETNSPVEKTRQSKLLLPARYGIFSSG